MWSKFMPFSLVAFLIIAKNEYSSQLAPGWIWLADCGAWGGQGGGGNKGGVVRLLKNAYLDPMIINNKSLECLDFKAKNAIHEQDYV